MSKSKTLEIVNAMLAKRKADDDLRDAPARAKEAREDEAFAEIWKAFEDVKDVIVESPRWHSHDKVPLGAAQIHTYSKRRNQLAFYGGNGDRGFGVEVSETPRGMEYRRTQGLGVTHTTLLKAEALNWFLEYVVDRMQGKVTL